MNGMRYKLPYSSQPYFSHDAQSSQVPIDKIIKGSVKRSAVEETRSATGFGMRGLRMRSLGVRGSRMRALGVGGWGMRELGMGALMDMADDLEEERNWLKILAQRVPRQKSYIRVQ